MHSYSSSIEIVSPFLDGSPLFGTHGCRSIHSVSTTRPEENQAHNTCRCINTIQYHRAQLSKAGRCRKHKSPRARKPTMGRECAGGPARGSTVPGPNTHASTGLPSPMARQMRYRSRRSPRGTSALYGCRSTRIAGLASTAWRSAAAPISRISPAGRRRSPTPGCTPSSISTGRHLRPCAPTARNRWPMRTMRPHSGTASPPCSRRTAM